VKFLTTLISTLAAADLEGSVRALLRLLVVLVVTVLLFSVGFHWLMAQEGREFTWWASVYWTLVTMSTLGYGDITFDSDPGRMFSLLVLFAGALLILVMLPFTFIQVVYLPWRAATRRASAPRRLPSTTSGHVIVAGLEPIGEALVDRLRAAAVPYAVLVDDVEEGLALHDAGFRVAVGRLDDPATYRDLQGAQARMVFSARADTTNTNIAFTLREVTDVPAVVATANSADAVDILQLAGVDRVLQLGELLGQEYARRILSPTARSGTIANFEDLVIAEATAAGTELVGRTLAELGLRRRFGVSVVGLWDRGKLEMGTPELCVRETSILILVGRREQLDAYDAAYAPPADDGDAGLPADPIVIIGGGRVGRATAVALREAGAPYRIVERQPDRVRDGDEYVQGDAADLAVLRRAGIERAPAIVITTHDDDTNLYLTLYCRKLRPDAEILGRVTVDRNLSTMYRAGADFVLSYASVGAAAAWNALRGESTLLLAEGLVVFRVPMPRELAGRPLRQTHLPRDTGCHVIAITHNGDIRTEIDLDAPLPADADLFLIGSDEGEERFLRRYVAGRPRSRLRRWWDEARRPEG
jgi:voltage-gated potassium channel